MSEDLGSGFDNHIDGLSAASEIVDEKFNSCSRALLADLARGFCIEPSRTIGEVIAGDTGDRRVAKPHLSDRFGDASGFVLVVFRGTPSCDIAKVAPSRADCTTQEESCFAVFPAFVDVRASSFCAYGVQPCAASKRTHVLVVFTRACGRTNPLGLILDGSLRVTNLYAQKLASLGIGESAHWVRPSEFSIAEAAGANVPMGAVSQWSGSGAE